MLKSLCLKFKTMQIVYVCYRKRTAPKQEACVVVTAGSIALHIGEICAQKHHNRDATKPNPGFSLIRHFCYTPTLSEAWTDFKIGTSEGASLPGWRIRPQAFGKVGKVLCRQQSFLELLPWESN